MIIALSMWNGAAAFAPVREHLGALERLGLIEPQPSALKVRAWGLVPRLRVVPAPTATRAGRSINANLLATNAAAGAARADGTVAAPTALRDVGERALGPWRSGPGPDPSPDHPSSCPLL